MSVAQAAARGVAWNMVFGVGARLIQLVGTLILTRFIAPDAYGAVLAASITVMTVGVLTTFAFGQYIIANRSAPRVVFQAMVVHVALGVVAMVPVVLLREPLGRWLDSPDMSPFVLGYAFSHLLDRVRYVPDRIVTRALRFRATATINGSSELLFTVVALATAPRLGAYAIMIGAIARSAWGCVASIMVAPREEWLAPGPVERSTVRDLFTYGLPITIASIADRAATRWDNLVMSKLFGPAVMARYNLAYSLAEVPISNVAEHIGEVLMPSFSRMEEEERRSACVRAAALMSLIVSPLGVGLAAVAPTLVTTFFEPRWAQMSTMLVVLSVMTVFRPMTWSSIAYMLALKKTKPVMVLAFARAGGVLSLIAIFGWLGGEIWACAGACVAIAIHSVATVLVGGRVAGFATGRYLVGAFRPLLACIPMFFVVLALRRALESANLPKGVPLACEIIVGGIVFIVCAFIFAAPTAKELIRLAKKTLKRK